MPNSRLDSTMEHLLPEGGGSGGSKPSNKYDSTMSLPVGSIPSPNEGNGSQRHANAQSSVNKPADNGIIAPKFFESVSGSPGSLDSTMQDVLELDFSR